LFNDSSGEKKSAGSKVGVYDFHGKPNQQWDFIPVSGAATSTGPAPVAHAATAAPLYPTADPYAGYPQYPQQPGRWGVKTLLFFLDFEASNFIAYNKYNHDCTMSCVAL